MEDSPYGFFLIAHSHPLHGLVMSSPYNSKAARVLLKSSIVAYLNEKRGGHPTIIVFNNNGGIPFEA